MTEITVPLLDLRAQYQTIKPEIDAAVSQVIESQICIFGPEVKALEDEIAAYCQAPAAVGCASGSDAVLVALMALGIEPGDEVICPSYTFFATGGSITRLGATPVFVDIDPATYNMDIEQTRAAAARCTRLKAIMPVHLFGQAVDMDAFLALGQELGVPVIEDAAQAIGARDATGARVGSRGLAGCFSFYPTKNLGAMGDGGMITSRDEAFADRVRMLCNHGMRPKYYHEIVGLNSRLDAIQAAILRVKLTRLDQWHAARARNAAFYDQRFGEAGARLSGVPFDDDSLAVRTPPAPAAPATHIYNQYVIRVPAAMRDDLRAHLGEQRIGSEIYYPVPLHMQACYAGLGYAPEDLPHSQAAAAETIALPIYPELTEAQLDHVASTIVQFVSGRTPVSTG